MCFREAWHGRTVRTLLKPSFVLFYLSKSVQTLSLIFATYVTSDPSYETLKILEDLVQISVDPKTITRYFVKLYIKFIKANIVSRSDCMFIEIENVGKTKSKSDCVFEQYFVAILETCGSQMERKQS